MHSQAAGACYKTCGALCKGACNDAPVAGAVCPSETTLAIEFRNNGSSMRL